MSASKSSKGNAERVAKRALFAGEKERPTGASPWVLVAGLVIVVALIGGVAFALTRPSPPPTASAASPPSADLGSNNTDIQGLLVSAATSGHEPYPQVVAENGAVRLPLATFDDYKAHHYTFMYVGRPIEFFVLKSNDGVVRAAFNACDVCFGSKKGYTQDGEYMVCNNCGRRFPADQINVVQGGCNPSPLERQVEDEMLVILVEDIVKGQEYF